MSRSKPSLRSRMIEWILWRLNMKKRLATTSGLRERVIASRPAVLKLPRSLYRRYRVAETARDGRPIFTLTPRRGRPTMRVLYLHGGAYVYEMEDAQWNMIKRLMKTGELEIIVPLYPLAPEHTCEEVLGFVHAVYVTLCAESGGQPIALLGDSAGGGMALALSQQLRDAHAAQPGCLVLLSPWLDVTCADPTQQDFEKLDPMLASPGLREEGRWYAGSLPMTDPRVSPLFGDVNGLPPMLVLTGTHDLLNPDAHRLLEKLVEQPSACTVSEYKNMLHVWPAMPIPEAQDAVDEMIAFLKRHAE